MSTRASILAEKMLRQNCCAAAIAAKQRSNATVAIAEGVQISAQETARIA